MHKYLTATPLPFSTRPHLSPSNSSKYGLYGDVSQCMKSSSSVTPNASENKQILQLQFAERYSLVLKQLSYHRCNATMQRSNHTSASFNRVYDFSETSSVHLSMGGGLRCLINLSSQFFLSVKSFVIQKGSITQSFRQFAAINTINSHYDDRRVAHLRASVQGHFQLSAGKICLTCSCVT